MYKKISLVMLVAVLTAGFANAQQLFVGGGLGLDMGGGKSTFSGVSTDFPKSMSFSFTPKVGYYLSDDLAVGAQIGFTSMSVKEEIPNVGTDKYSLSGWEVGAFARYKVAGPDKLSLLLEASLGVGGGKEKFTSGGTTNEGDPISTFAIGVLPVLSYSLTDKLSIEASCDLLRFGFSSTTIKDLTNSNDKITFTDFGFGVNSASVRYDLISDEFSSSNIWRIGVIFKF